jgi:predicted glycoside hydrolase/deacetylase ChbG (UPF0249 family)
MAMSIKPERFLIVNADDFGQSHGVNAGVAAAHERGIVTSASLMVRWDAAVQAAEYARTHPDLGIGLHVDLGEWAFRDGRWVPIYQVVPTHDRDVVAIEVERQLARFRELIGRNPTHVDSHQHVHRSDPIRSIVADLAARLAIPLRESNEDVAYSNAFYGQSGNGLPFPRAITAEMLIESLAALPPGITELGCHPARDNDLDSMYTQERSVEVDTLCDPKVRASLADLRIQLCNFDTRPRVLRSSS